MIFDGDCNFCRRWIARWQQTTGDRVDYLPFQDSRVAERFPELPRADLEQAVHLLEPGGEVTRGAEAVARALAVRTRWPLRFYRTVPGAAVLAETAYAFVARHRALCSAVTRVLWGRHVERPAKRRWTSPEKVRRNRPGIAVGEPSRQPSPSVPDASRLSPAGPDRAVTSPKPLTQQAGGRSTPA